VVTVETYYSKPCSLWTLDLNLDLGGCEPKSVKNGVSHSVSVNVSTVMGHPRKGHWDSDYIYCRSRIQKRDKKVDINRKSTKRVCVWFWGDLAVGDLNYIVYSPVESTTGRLRLEFVFWFGYFAFSFIYIGSVLKTQTRFVYVNTNTNENVCVCVNFGSEITDTQTNTNEQ